MATLLRSPLDRPASKQIACISMKDMPMISLAVTQTTLLKCALTAVTQAAACSGFMWRFWTIYC